MPYVTSAPASGDQFHPEVAWMHRGKRTTAASSMTATLNSRRDKFSTVPKWTMASGQRDGKEWGVFPGPGQYKPEKAPRGCPRWGFGSETRLHEVKQDSGPGPGAYETRGNLEGLKFSVSSRPGASIKKSDAPGPGQYKPSYDQIFETAARSSFGGAVRSDLAPSKTPGPGQYESFKVLGGSCSARSMPRYSIAGKRPEPATDQSPGPGPPVTQFSRG